MKGINLEYGYSSNIEQKISLISQAGFDSLLLYYDEHIEQSIEIAQRSNLMIDALHLPYKGMVNNMWQDKIVAEPFLQLLISCIDVASYYGIEDVVLHISSTITPPEYNPNGLRFIEKLLNHCEKKKIYLCLENLRRLDYISYVYKNIYNPYLAFCFDSGHANAFTHNISEFPWDEMPANIRCVHLHDNDGTEDQHLLPYDGNIPFDKIFKRIHEGITTQKISLELHKNASKLYQCNEKKFLEVCFERISVFYERMKNQNEDK